MKRPAVFLDRDNTIIHNDGDLGDPEQVKLIQGVAPAIASLCGLGYKVVVVTNQGGAARGKYTEADVDAVHDRIEELIRDRANGARIDAFYHCPYHPQGTVPQYKKEHPNRKPKPGMLLQAAEDLDLDLSQSWMVGDALRDIDAGGAAGCRTVLLQADFAGASLSDLRKMEATKPGGLGPKSRKKQEPDFIAKGLVEAVRIIASQRKPEASEEISRTRIAGKRWDAQAMAELQKQGRRPPVEGEASAGSGVEPAAKSDGPSADEQVAEQASADGIEPVATAAPLRLPGQTPAGPGGEKVNRPFVPWTRQQPSPPRPVGGVSGLGKAGPEAAAPVDGENPATAAAAPVASPPASTPAPDETASTAEPTPASPTPAPARPANRPPIEAASEPAPIVSPEALGDSESLHQLNKSLRMILQEMRAQRGSSGEMHQLSVAAIALQAVAFICMLGALWMGGGDGGDSAFLRWIGVSLVLQLTVIAVLLFSRPSS